MECCNLDKCDFLETKFKEYEYEEEFWKDGTFKLTEKDQPKGIIISFHGSSGPIYKYMPFKFYDS